ncbi:MAG: PilN domain-containing protein [Armatimonadetes bacterium]|nr:PilN domain-containing protein [Armatimonadota bacterium]
MPLINLIQEQRQIVRREEQRARSFAMMFGASLVGSFLLFGFFFLETESLKGEQSKLQAELQRLKPVMEQIDDNNKALADMQPRVKTLEDAQAMTGRWGRILQHVAVQTPTPVWLTTVRAIGADPFKPISVSFAGMSATNAPIGEFMQRLQNSDDLEAVSLKYTQEKLAANLHGLEFEISAEITGTAEEKPKTQEEPAK